MNHDLSDISSEESFKDDENISNLKDLLIFPKRIKSGRTENDVADAETFEKIRKLLTCPICMEIFHDPVYIKDCSHRFCKLCIEKTIRIGEIKSCPSCRKSIGTKRLLRIDNNILSIMIKIFTDIENYAHKQSEIEKIEIMEKFNIEIKDTLPLKRIKSKIEYEENEIENKEFKEKTRKKRKLNQDVVPETEILQEKSRVYAYYFRKPFSIVLEKKNLEEDFNIIDLFTNNPDIINEIERIIIFKVEVAPSDFFLSQIQKNIFRCNEELTLHQISKAICLKLNLKPNKYSQQIKLIVKTSDRLVEIDKNDSLKQINNKFWKTSKGLSVYDKEDFFKEIVNNASFEFANRIIYYSLDYSCFL